MHHPSLTLVIALAFLGALSHPPTAAAQSTLESSAPSQALPTDPAPPVPRLAMTADPLALYFGHYGFAFAYAPTRTQSLWLAPAWTRRGNDSGLSLALGWHLWPMARGLDGVFLGPVVTAGTARGAGAVWDARVGGELGYQAVWGGVALGVAVGAEYRWRRRGGSMARGAALRLRLSLGWGEL